jgi:hypothetical protein
MSKKEVALVPKITLEELMNECSKYLTLHIFQFLADERVRSGEEFSEKLAFNFLASFVASLGAGYLNADYGDLPSKEMQQAIMDGFLEFKQNLQDAVASGVSGAMTVYSGQSVDYYCQVKLVPPDSGRMDS